MITENKRLTGIMIAVATLLLIPFIAMQFTHEVNWSVFDFIVAGVLLFGTGLLCELVLRDVHKIEYRIAICAVLLLALFLIWAELAVGIFGTPLAGS
ncbi:hypothetical protein [Spirosoma jeollabukense]